MNRLDRIKNCVEGVAGLFHPFCKVVPSRSVRRCRFLASRRQRELEDGQVAEVRPQRVSIAKVPSVRAVAIGSASTTTQQHKRTNLEASRRKALECAYGL